MDERTLFDASPVNRGARFSPCRTWRYALWREWDTQLSPMVVIGLNPSTADETQDDPTIRRCIGFAKSWGFGSLYMLNLYAFRATKPLDMVQSDDPVGPDSDAAFLRYCAKADLVLAAWGALTVRWRPRVQWQQRIAHVRDLLDQDLHCLGMTSDGSPRHPLYVKGDTQPVVYQ